MGLIKFPFANLSCTLQDKIGTSKACEKMCVCLQSTSTEQNSNSSHQYLAYKWKGQLSRVSLVINSNVCVYIYVIVQ